MMKIGFEPDDDLFIRQHTARIGTSFQSFVFHAVKKEIKQLKDIAEAEAKRQQRKQNFKQE